MKKYIESLREKPEPVKKAIALFSSLGIVAVIAIIWATTLPARFATSSQQAAVIESDSDGAVTLESFQDQIQNLNDKTWGMNTDTSGGTVDSQVIISDTTSDELESPSFTIAPKEQ